MTSKNVQTERWLWIFIAITAIARLYFTSDRGILALNSPHDEFWYIQTASRYIWGGSHDNYNQMTIIHLPIYSAWLDFLRLFRMPARLGIDVGWLLAGGYLAFAFLRLTRMKWLAGFLFAFLAFHPYTISIFDRALAETFLAVVCAAVLGAGIELWNCRDAGSSFRHRVAFVVYVVGFAVAFHTRKEGVVLVVPLLALACRSWFDRQRWWSGANRQKLAIPMLLKPILVTILLGLILSSANYAKWGVFARYELSAPGYQRTIAALNSIDVGRTPKQFTVTKEVLAQAYKVSPTITELQPFMETGIGKMWVSISSQNTGIPGEIGNGFFLWALRDVAAQAGWHKDARFADSKYAAVADELENAFATGRLKKRGFGISSFLDPDVGKWMPDMPQSILNVSQLVVRPRLADLVLPSESASPGQLEKYVVITGRRAESSDTGRVIGVNGWIKMPVGSSVGLGTGDTTFSWTHLSGSQRPDVPGAYAFSVSANGAEVPTELHFQTPDGKYGSIALNALKAQATATITGVLQVELGIDSLKYSEVAKADKWLSKLCTIYQFVGYLFCLVTIGALLLLMVRRRPLTGIALVLALVIVAIMARVALFSIIDASSFNAIQARYMLPVIPVFACMGAIGFALLGDFFEKKQSE